MTESSKTYTAEGAHVVTMSAGTDATAAAPDEGSTGFRGRSDADADRELAAGSVKEATATGHRVVTMSAGLDASAAPPEEPVAWTAGEPKAAVAAPGSCAIGEEFVALPLLARTWCAKDTIIVTFGLADEGAPLGLSTCACVVARAGDGVIRPYTPVSTNTMLGNFAPTRPSPRIRCR